MAKAIADVSGTFNLENISYIRDYTKYGSCITITDGENIYNASTFFGGTRMLRLNAGTENEVILDYDTETKTFTTSLNGADPVATALTYRVSSYDMGNATDKTITFKADDTLELYLESGVDSFANTDFARVGNDLTIAYSDGRLITATDFFNGHTFDDINVYSRTSELGYYNYNCNAWNDSSAPNKRYYVDGDGNVSLYQNLTSAQKTSGDWNPVTDESQIQGKQCIMENYVRYYQSQTSQYGKKYMYYINKNDSTVALNKGSDANYELVTSEQQLIDAGISGYGIRYFSGDSSLYIAQNYQFYENTNDGTVKRWNQLTAEEKAATDVWVQVTNVNHLVADAVYYESVASYTDGAVTPKTVMNDATINVVMGDTTYTGTDYKENIFGTAGNDTIKGGEERDIITGGAGNDTLYGGDGEVSDGVSNTFVFREGDGTDTIMDAKNGDIIRLDWELDDDNASAVYDSENGQAVFTLSESNVIKVNFDYTDSSNNIDTFYFLDDEDGDIVIDGHKYIEISILDNVTFSHTITADYDKATPYTESIVVDTADNITITGLEEDDEIVVMGDEPVFTRSNNSSDLVINGKITVGDFFTNGEDFDVVYGNGDDDAVNTAGMTLNVELSGGHAYTPTHYTEHISGTGSVAATALMIENSDELTIAGTVTYERTNSGDLHVKGTGSDITITGFDFTDATKNIYVNGTQTTTATTINVILSGNCEYTTTAYKENIILSGDASEIDFAVGCGDKSITLGTSGYNTVLKFIDNGSNSKYNITENSDGSVVLIRKTGTVTDNITITDYIANGQGKVSFNGRLYTATEATVDLLENIIITSTKSAEGVIFNQLTVNSNPYEGSWLTEKIVGTNNNDTIYGGAGNDNIDGKKGDDIIYGDAGNDYLYGNAGNDTIYGGDGDDQILPYSGNDTVYAGAGNDYIKMSGNANGDTNYLYGEAGDDEILLVGKTGGTVTTHVWGDDADGNYHGADTFKINHESANNIIYDATSNDKLHFIGSVAGSVPENLKFDDLVFSRSGDDLLITTEVQTNTIKDFFTSENPIDTVEFLDKAEYHYYYEDGASTQDVKAYQYYVNNNDPSDVRVWGEGLDTSVYTAVKHTEQLTNVGIETWQVSSFPMYNDVLQTYSILNDVTINVTLAQGETYSATNYKENFSLAEGATSASVSGLQAADNIDIDAGYTLSRTINGTNNGTLVITTTGGKTVNVTDFNFNTAVADVFKVGNANLITDLAVTLSAGGQGNKYVASDIYSENITYSTGGTTAYVSNLKASDTLTVPGVTKYFRNTWDKLALSNDSYTLVYVDDFNTNRAFTFNDGTGVVDFSTKTLTALMLDFDATADSNNWGFGYFDITGGVIHGTLKGGANADIITAGSGGATIYGNGGNDTLNGAAGVDTIYSGTGNDTISGAGGNDTFIFNAGDGVDTITDAEAGDVIKFGDKSYTALSFARIHGYDLEIKYSATDKVVIEYFFVDDVEDRINDIYTLDSNVLTHHTISDLAVFDIVLDEASGPFDKTDAGYAGYKVNISLDEDNATGYVSNLEEGDNIVLASGALKRIWDGTNNAALSISDGTNTINVTDYFSAGGSTGFTLNEGVLPTTLDVTLNDTTNAYTATDFIETFHGTGKVAGINSNDKLTFNDALANLTYKRNGNDLVVNGLAVVDYYTSKNMSVAGQYANIVFDTTDETGATLGSLNVTNIENVSDIIGTNADETIKLTAGTVNETEDILSGNKYTSRATGVEYTVNAFALGGGGADTIHGTTGNDWINGGAGNDTIYGGITGHDMISGGAGDDYIYAGDESGDWNTTGSELYGDLGNDHIFGGNGNDYIRGNAGDDTLTGNGGADTFMIESGADVIKDATSADTIKFVVDDHTKFNGITFEKDGTSLKVVYGETWTATIEGYFNVDGSVAAGHVNTFTLASELGQVTYTLEWLYSNTAQDYAMYNVTHNPNGSAVTGIRNWIDGMVTGTDGVTITGKDQYDMLAGTQNGDTITAGDNGAELYGDAGNDTLIGGAGNDYIQGNSGDDKLYGNGGNDKLITNDGNDEAYGGAGNDQIYIDGAGTKYVEGGEGNDKFHIIDLTANTTIGHATADDTLSFHYNQYKFSDLIFSRQADNLKITFNGAGNTGSIVVEDFFTAESPLDSIVAYDNNGVEKTYGILTDAAINVDLTQFAETYEATGYKEVISGTGTVTGMSAADKIVTAGEPVYSRTDNGNLFVDAIEVADFNWDGQHNINVNAGTTAGMTVNVTVTGGTYQSLSAYAEKITTTATAGVQFCDTFIGTDTLVFNTVFANLRFKRNQNDLIIKNGDIETKILGYYDNHDFSTVVVDVTDDVNDTTLGALDINEYENVSDFRDNSGASITVSLAKGEVNEVEDVLNGSTYTSNFDGKTYNVDAFALVGSGSDTIYGTDGNDWINGGAGVDKLYGGDGGHDMISGGAGDDFIYGSANNTTASELYGAEGSDTIFSGAGDDFIWGGQGNDTIDLTNGGKNIIMVAGEDANFVETIQNSSADDTLKLTIGAAGYKFSELVFEKQADDLIIRTIDGGQVKVVDLFVAPSKLDKIIALDDNGFAKNYSIINDVAFGITLDAMAPAFDKVASGYGNYRVRVSGNGSVEGLGANDRIVMNSETTYTQTTVNSLTITDGTDTITVTNYVAGSEPVVVAGGEVDNLSTKVLYVTGMANFDGTNSVFMNVDISGTAGDDDYIGTDRNDVVNTLAGTDKVRAGKGDDHIYGGTGAKTFEFARFDGIDTLYNTDNTDTIKIVDASGASYGRDGNDLVITYNTYKIGKKATASDRVVVSGYFAGTKEGGIKNIQFADNNVDISTITFNISGGGNINDTFLNDNITGSKKKDTYNITSGGIDSVYDKKGNDSYTANVSGGLNINDKAGKDYYNVNVAAGAYANITEKAGNDYYDLTSAGSIGINDKKGNDKYNATISNNLSVYDKSGKDTYNINVAGGAAASIDDRSGNDKYNLTVSGDMNIYDKKGKETYSANVSKTLNITDKSGKDKYYISTAAGGNTNIYDYAGNENYSLSGAGSMYVYDKKGNDKYYISNAARVKIDDAKGNDRYNVDLSTSKFVEIADTKGTDLLILNNVTVSSLKCFVNINAGGDIENGNLIISTQNAGGDYGSLQIDQYFKLVDGSLRDKGAGNIELKQASDGGFGYTASSAMQNIDAIKASVSGWLSGNGYANVSDVFSNALGKTAEASTTDIANLIAAYTPGA